MRQNNVAQAVFVVVAALLVAACGGGTQAVLEAELERDRARQALRAEQDAQHAAAQQTDAVAALAAAPALVAGMVGLPVEQVQGWAIEPTPGGAFVLAADPVAHRCVVLVRAGAGLRAFSVGRPPATPTPAQLAELYPPDAPWAGALSLSDELQALDGRVAARCRPVD